MMNGVQSTSLVAAAAAAGDKLPLDLSEGMKAILKAHHEELLKVRQKEGGKPLFKTLSFVLENDEVVVAEGPVMAQFCTGIDPGIDFIDVPVGVAKEAVVYFIKTVYLREEAIRAIPSALFRDVVTLAFAYNALDWEDHLCKSKENLASIYQLVTDDKMCAVVRTKAAEYTENYCKSVRSHLDGQPRQGSRRRSGSESPSSRRSRARRAKSPSSSDPNNPRERSRSPHSGSGQRSKRIGSREAIRRNQQHPPTQYEDGDANASSATVNSATETEKKTANSNNNSEGRMESPTIKKKSALPKKNRKKQARNRNNPGRVNPTDSDGDEEFVGPKDKGMDGTTITTQRKSLRQAHIQAAKKQVAAGMDLEERLLNAKPGETIDVGPGTYELEALTLELPPGVKIVGQGENTIIKGRPGEEYIWWIDEKTEKDCIIENLHFQMDGVKGTTDGPSGLVLCSPVTIRNCIFTSCELEFDENSDDSLCEGSTFDNSQWGIYFHFESRNAQVKNCKFRNLMYGVMIWGNDHKLEDLDFQNVDNGILIRGDNVWSKAEGMIPEDAVTGRGNVIENVTYHFWDEDVEQLGIKLVGENNILTTIKCTQYPRTSTHKGRTTASGLQKVGLQIQNEKDNETKAVLILARNNTIKGFKGAPIEVEGETNTFETVRDCPFFRRKGNHTMTDCEFDDFEEVCDDGQEVVEPKTEEL